MRAWALTPLFVLAFAGCVGIQPAVCLPLDSFSLWGRATPEGSIGRSLNQTAHQASASVLYWFHNPYSEPVTPEPRFESGSTPLLTSFDHILSDDPLPPDGRGFGYSKVVEHRAAATDKPNDVNLSLFKSDSREVAPGAHVYCNPSEEPVYDIRLNPGRTGAPPTPGTGVWVHTAGFWENGTLFYTNMDRVNNDTRVPKAGWYQYGGGASLRVYVYNTSAKERPSRYNQTGNAYSPTIQGFNTALKTLPDTGSVIAHIPAEQAYTQPGREKHRLYGDNLVFYIEIEKRVTVPCPLPQPVCDYPVDPPKPPLGSTVPPHTAPLIYAPT